MNSALDHIWHRWINDRAKPQRGDWNGPCVFCGKLLDEHGKMTHRGRLCPGTTSSYFTPKPFTFDKEHPPIGTMYAWKSAVQMLAWAGQHIQKARDGKLRQVHQHCSHCQPEQIEGNVLTCWLGKDVAKCEILDDLAATFAKERRGYYERETKPEDVYELMGYVCVWHLLVSHLATKDDQLPPPAFVDWNEGAFYDKSDRMFWERVYDSMGKPEEPEEQRP